MLTLVLLSLFIFLLASVDAAQVPLRRANSECRPFQSSFSTHDVSRSGGAPFQVVSPEGSVSTGGNGLNLYLDKPQGSVHTTHGMNDVVAEGATVNSTFVTLYGKITFEVSAPAVPGVVTAAILIADEHDEIDVELLGGDSKHWQSNIFTTSPRDKEPLWGVFGEIEDYSKKGTIDETHRYTIDWNEERIIWSVDGTAMRTLRKSETKINGTFHYPSHAARIQLGIWDASNPAGTAEWAKGPIDWEAAPHRMVATFKSVSVECFGRK